MPNDLIALGFCFELEIRTPSTMKRSNLKHITDSCNTFLGTLKPEVKACLYFLTINDVTGSKCCLENIPRKAKAFNGQINMWRDDCLQKNAAAVQHSLKIEQHNKYIIKEKDQLQKAINQMKRTIASLSSFDKKENEEIGRALLFTYSYFDVDSPKRRKHINLNDCFIQFTIHFNVHST